ncbi:MAG: peptidylprolyl isomerase [bacterium]|nr:peptidylprolyl isomerase [bacterium]
MKRLFVLAITLVLTQTVVAQEDPVIMTIDDKEITKSEFLQIYLKNNDDPKYDKASLDEYMELFKKFKLKVAEAEALGYDTIPKLVRELNGYTKQLANPYLVDSTKIEELVKEAYDRTANEVRASHILIQVSQNALPKDTLAAYNRIMALRKRVLNGEDFGAVASGPGGSEDPSAKSNNGDLGYFTAFQMVYPFEDMAYNTKVGEVSMPFRTRFGYHIIYVADKRPARGSMESAHIFVSARAGEPEDAIESSRKKADEIYDLLESGEDFEELVKKYSDDPSSVNKEGKLPPFGTGTTTRMLPAFEDAAFAIENDGEYTAPVQTDYGFHIIKRLKRHPVPSFEDLKPSLEKRVAKDSRSKQTQKSFVVKLKKEYGFKDKSEKGLKWFYENVDSTFYSDQKFEDKIKKDKPLFILDKQKYTQKDFALFLQTNYRGIRKGGEIKPMIDEQYEKWEEKSILGYEESKLAYKYPAYRALVTEYHDGILLYEIMSDMVWNKAMKDTTGLKEYHANNSGNYRWNKRYDADIFDCNSKEVAEKVYALLTSEGADTMNIVDIVQKVNTDSELNTRHRNGKFDVEKSSFVKGQDLKVGINDIYEIDGKYYVARVNEILPPAEKEFSEAKGAVTSDYQSYLEDEWLKELRNKHKISVNEDVLYSLGK